MSIECAFTGRLAHEPEIKTSKAGTPWASLSVGVGESDALQWVRVAVFGEMAEAIRALPKGAKVYVEGRLKLEEWTGKDGVARHGLNVPATLAQPLGQIGRRRPSKPSGDPVKPTGDPVRDWQRPVAAAGAPSGQRDPLSEPIPF